MNIRRYVVLAAAVLTLTAAPFVAWADEPHDGHSWSGHGYGHRMGGHHGWASHYLKHLIKHQRDLGLSDEQVTKLKDLRLNLDRTQIRTKADIAIAHRELKELIDNPATDFSAIEAKVKQRADLTASLQLAGIKAKRDAKALLTPEQLDKLKAEREKRMQHRGRCGAGERQEHADIQPAGETVS